jgi:hypothetical protein
MWQNKKQDFEYAILKKNQWENQCEKWLHLLFNNLLGKLGKTLSSNEVTKNKKYAKGECWKIKNNTLLTIDRRVGGAIEKKLQIYMCVWNWC